MKTEIFRVVFEDSDLLVIEKLSPFLSQRADQGDQEGLYEFIARVRQEKLFPVHRLDREVLGLMIFAKNKESADKLSEEFRNREVEKAYEATVSGRVSKDSDTLVHYLKKNDRTNYVTVFPKPTEGAKRAELSYEVLERNPRSTRLLVHLKTGRSHQIRAQLAKIGHPILGDTRYGHSTKSDEDSPKGQIQLRSVILGVRHPRTNEFLRWSAEAFHTKSK